MLRDSHAPQPEGPSFANRRQAEEREAAHASSNVLRQPGVLVADDLGLVLVLLKAEIQQLGCAVWLASDGREAVELYEQHHEAIDMVLLDVQMAGLDGPQVLAGLREIEPTVRCCFMAGYGGAYTRKDLRKLRPERIFDKPFNPAVVAQAVWELLCPSGHWRDEPCGTK